MTNYLFKLALSKWKQIKFQFLSVYSWKILFIIRKDVFLYSGENCNNYILYTVTKQNVQMRFLFQLFWRLWEYFLLHFVLYNADFFFSPGYLIEFLIKTMGEKAIGQLESMRATERLVITHAHKFNTIMSWWVRLQFPIQQSHLMSLQTKG